MPSSEWIISRKVNAPRPGTIRLWSLQPVEVWHRLQEHGALYVDPALIADEHWTPAYNWLRGQMARRIPGYGGNYPWWAYDFWLDLRRYRYQAGEAGTRWVRLELAIPPEQVLLSAYGAWHYVLNEWYLPHAAAPDEHRVESDAWDAELSELGLSECPSLPEPWRSRMIGSWERIFDVEELRDTNTVQATFECLRLDDVVKVTEFTAAGSRVWIRDVPGFCYL